jgi:hypothetical protein
MPPCTERPAHARHAASMQCSPAGLTIALAVIITSYLSYRHYAGLLTVVRVTAAIALALAGTGLLTWVTVGLTRRAARTGASEPAKSSNTPRCRPLPARDAITPIPLSTEVPDRAADPMPITLITRDGRTLVLAHPGPAGTRP